MLGIVTESTAVWLALVLGLVTLAIQGYRYARIAALGRIGTASILVVNLLLGASVVLMKVMLVH